jgi:hypothetical protein
MSVGLTQTALGPTDFRVLAGRKSSSISCLTRKPAPFALTAGWGEVLIGVTALPVAYLAAIKAPAWRTSTLVWSALGFIDLVLAVALGVASSPGIPFGFRSPSAHSGLMTTLPWILIPCFNVPLLAHLHLLIFQRLWLPSAVYAGSLSEKRTHRSVGSCDHRQ